MKIINLTPHDFPLDENGAALPPKSMISEGEIRGLLAPFVENHGGDVGKPTLFGEDWHRLCLLPDEEVVQVHLFDEHDVGGWPVGSPRLVEMTAEEARNLFSGFSNVDQQVIRLLDEGYLETADNMEPEGLHVAVVEKNGKVVEIRHNTRDSEGLQARYPGAKIGFAPMGAVTHARVMKDLWNAVTALAIQRGWPEEEIRTSFVLDDAFKEIATLVSKR